MLNWNTIIRYCKRRIGFPYAFIEYTDTEIKEDLKESCLGKFSTYFPDKRTMSLNGSDSNSRVPNRPDMFYVHDPDGKSILSIDEFVPPGGDEMITGHPWMGAMNYNTIPQEMLLGAYQSNNLKQFSIFNYTFHYYPPDQIQITPQWKGRAALYYSREHLDDLSTIPPDLTTYFKDLCLASFKKQVGALRKNYTQVTTPFGEIPLNGEALYSEGEQEWEKLIERFETASAPFIIFDKG